MSRFRSLIVSTALLGAAVVTTGYAQIDQGWKDNIDGSALDGMTFYIFLAAVGGALIVAGYLKVNGIGTYSDYKRRCNELGLTGEFFEAYRSHTQTERGVGKFFIIVGLVILSACVWNMP